MSEDTIIQFINLWHWQTNCNWC